MRKERERNQGTYVCAEAKDTVVVKTVQCVRRRDEGKRERKGEERHIYHVQVRPACKGKSQLKHTRPKKSSRKWPQGETSTGKKRHG